MAKRPKAKGGPRCEGMKLSPRTPTALGKHDHAVPGWEIGTRLHQRGRIQEEKSEKTVATMLLLADGESLSAKAQLPFLLPILRDTGQVRKTDWGWGGRGMPSLGTHGRLDVISSGSPASCEG